MIEYLARFFSGRFAITRRKDKTHIHYIHVNGNFIQWITLYKFEKMFTLYLVRHAKSSWSNPNLSDFDRPLNDRGTKDAPRMGKRLKEREIAPDLMLSSPANRAITTCKEIASILGYDASRIKTDRRIYHAGEDELFTVLSELSDTQKVVMLFGHNPGFTLFANILFNQHIMNIPTCGVVAGKLKIKSWSEIKAGCGKLEFFDFPKNKQS